MRISRALGFSQVEKSAAPQGKPLSGSRWTRPEQIPSLAQIHEWVENKNWDAILVFANPHGYSSRILPKARDALDLITVSLGGCNDTRATPALLILLHFDYYVDLSQTAAISLSKIGDERTLALLEEFIASVDDGTHPRCSIRREYLKASISYLRARLNNRLSLLSNKSLTQKLIALAKGSHSLFVQGEREYASGNFGQARFSLESVLADMAGSHPRYFDAKVLLARSCAKMGDDAGALQVITPILGNLPETSRRQILSDVRYWLWSHPAFQGYLPMHDDTFQLALNIELELALKAKTPDELLRALREQARWLEKLGASDCVQLIRQSVRTEAPGTGYVAKHDRTICLRHIMLSENMRCFLAALDVRIRSEAIPKLKEMMRSQHFISLAAPASGNSTTGTPPRAH